MIKEVLFFTYLAIILLSALSAFIFREWLKSRMLVLFIPYLLYVFIQELILYLGRINHWGVSTNFTYNIFRLVTVLTFALMYFHLPFMKAVRKYIASLAILYTLIFVVSFVFIQSIYGPGSPLGMVRDLILSLYGLLFLYSYFNFDEVNEIHFWTPWIWITTGIVIFYPVSSLSITFQDRLSGSIIDELRLYQLIPQAMSIFMYSCFSYAFYLCRKR
jgi:hypothetical protein